MRYVDPKWWKLTLVASFAAGAMLQLAWATIFSGYLFGRAPIGTFASVNFILPTIVTFAAFCYPRVRVAGVAAVMAFVGYVCVGLLRSEANPLRWNAALLEKSLHPILLGACVGYVALAATVAAWTKRYRRVGREEDRERCTACGYLLVGVTAGVCPECGRRALTAIESS